ncbi:MAG: type I DNA topoisomerase [Candidatus Hydrogenedentes bacterium]|nr:type I DNA topoisomerase [Candidatus Hydrogenedentota bacterium]
MVKLVIVESPAKAKTISRFLGKGYKVMASYGHIRDLPSSASEIPASVKAKPWARLAVDTENGFTPVYVVPKESKARIAELKQALKEADEVVLATDEDREGESISWHLLETLKPKVPVKRIAFHEITQSAIDEALANPRQVDNDLVRAQESRRVLDRLFGYELSPVLWKKVAPKLSAGRVQSVAVRLVVEREEERKAFRTASYWSVEAQLAAGGIEFIASLAEWDGKRPATGKDFDSATGALKDDLKTAAEVKHLLEADAAHLVDALRAGLPWRVTRVEQKKSTQRPWPPFITSTLQQAASSLLNMSPRKTMQVAQSLYEGVDLGGGEREGVITYMRTDSLTLSEKALSEAGRVIQKIFGDSYYAGPRRYTTKSKNAQEAHEAIRPTHLDRTPDQIASYLDEDQLALYRLIWNRTIASQMADAVLLKTTADIEARADGKTVVLRANGSVVSFPGYLRVADSAQRDTELPHLEEGQRVVASGAEARGDVALKELQSNPHRTQPPARYTEASLVQRLEEEGIGRPSTYAPTVTIIQNRGYVERRGKALVSTFLAVAVIQLLRKHFEEYVDLGFTARMEDALDDISNGKQNWVDFLSGFYHGEGRFGHGLVPQIKRELPNMDFPAISIGQDPDTGQSMVVRVGRSSPFIQRGDGGPENTATIPNDVTYEELDVEKALELLRHKERSSEALGNDPETGQPIFALLGPYGPYVQLGEKGDTNKKPKRASLPKGMTLDQIDLPKAIRLLSLPRELGTHPERGEAVLAAVGRFGPFVKCGDEFRSLESGDDVYTITRERALELLAQPKKSRRMTKTVLATLGADPATQKPIELCDGRYGPFVTNGEVNASLPKRANPAACTLEQALELLAASAKKPAKPKKKPSAKRRTK